MSKLARPLMLLAMLAAMNMAAMSAVAHADMGDDPASTRHRALGRVEFLATDQPSGQADATVRRLLARERSSLPDRANAAPAQTTSPVRPAPPSGQAGSRILALGGVAAFLALVAAVTVMVARRAHRSQRAGQTA